MVNRVKTQEINPQDREVFDSETKAGTGGFSFKPGSTAFMLVYPEGASPLSAFAATKSFYKGKENTRFVAYALLYGTQNTEEPLPDHLKEQLTPIYMPKLLARELGNATLAGTSFTGGEQPGAKYTMQDKNGLLYFGDLFVVGRVGSGLDTKYSVTVERDLSDEYLADFPAKVDVPEKGIQQVAEENTEAQMAKQNAPPSQEQPEQQELAGFR